MEAMRTGACTGPCSATTPPAVTTAAAATPAPQPSTCARASTTPVLLPGPEPRRQPAFTVIDDDSLPPFTRYSSRSPLAVLGPALGSLTTVVSALVTWAATVNVL